MFSKLGILDKLLTPIILLSMIVGVIIGEFVPGVQAAFDTVRFDSVSVRKSTALPP
jgi:ACR3 family arsenite transporter